MLNLMIADVQRIFRGRAIYVGIGVLLFMVGMHALGTANAFNPELANSGATMPFHLMMLAENVLLVTGITIFIVGSDDFIHGTVKNLLTNEMTRTKFFISKLLLAWAFSTLFYFTHVVGGTLLTTVLNGFGGTFDFQFISEVARPFFSQLLMILAVTSIGVMIMFLLRNSYFTMIYMGVLFGPMMIINFLVGFHEGFERLIYFDILSQMRELVAFSQLTSGDLARIFGSGIGYIIVSVVIVVIFFRRAEIK